ncbi:MAG: S24 family peptidase [Actinomycetota bacterium]
MIRLPVSTLLLTELLAWRRGDRERMRIVGPSMAPTLTEDEHVLVDATRLPVLGELAAARPEELDGLQVVKRVSHRTDDGGYWLVSDNAAAGTASEVWGAVPADRIDGVVTVNLSRRKVLVEPQDRGRWGWIRL